MALVGAPTFIIGILPTYAQIGFWAPLILILCRCLQGFFYGAEFAGVSVHTYENFEHSGHVAKTTGFLITSGNIGAALATGLGAFFTMGCMPDQAWRIPFILGGIAAFFVFFWRQNVLETPSFQQAKACKKIVNFPTKELWRYRREILVSLAIVSLNTVPLYLVTVFGNHMFRQFGYTPSQSMLLNMSTLIFDSIMIIVYSSFADRVGFKLQITVGCVWMILFAFPSFYMVSSWPSLLTIYAFMLLISTGNALVASCTMPYISALFPTNCRFSAVALATTMGAAFIAGNTPMAATYLIQKTGYKTAPALWLILVVALALAGMAWIERSKKKKTHGRIDLAVA